MTDNNFLNTCILMHGPPKVGKTYVAAHFPGPVIFLATERGHRFVQERGNKVIRLPYEEEAIPKKWARITQVKNRPLRRKEYFCNGWEKMLFALENTIKPPIGTFVVDTIGGLYQQCFDHVCRTRGIEHADDQPHGKGWAAVKREFLQGLQAIDYFAEKNKAVLILLAHSRQDELKAAGKTFHKITVDLPGQARGIVMPNPDYIWYLGFDPESGLTDFKKNRALWLQPTSVVEAGDRDDKSNATFICPLDKDDPYNHIVRYYKENHE